MSIGGFIAPHGESCDAEYVQLLSPDGDLIDHPEYDVNLSEEEFRNLYRDIVMVRRLDAEAIALQRQGELGLWPSLYGQEAAQVGSGRAARPQDMIFPTYREHGVLYCRGVDPLGPFSLFRGTDYGSWDPLQSRFHTYTLVVGAQTLHATGYAMGVMLDGKIGDNETGEAVLAYFGDGASSQGDVNEAFVWAGVYGPPIVFLCQNNQYAISEPVERQSRIPLYLRAKGFGFSGVRVDGNDVVAVYTVTRKALDAARAGMGPMLIEAYTYRMGAHTTSDDPTRYRSKEEVDRWALMDPMRRLRVFLEREKIGSADFFTEVEISADQYARELRQRVIEIRDPSPISMFDHVYAEGSELIDAERAEFIRYESSFADTYGDPHV